MNLVEINELKYRLTEHAGTPTTERHMWARFTGKLEGVDHESLDSRRDGKGLA